MRRTLLILGLLAACGRHGSGHRDAAAALGEDPGRRLTEAECGTAVDHAIALLEADPDSAGLAAQMKAGRDDHVTECVKTGTLRDYRCLMASKDLAALGGCPMPGGK